MPRKATASVVRVSNARLAPPAYLAPDQVAEWTAIVDSLAADFFRPSDVPLLAAYCVASSLYKRAVEDIAKNGLMLTTNTGRRYVNPAHQLLTAQGASLAQLSQKLRLAPSARVIVRSAKNAANAAPLPTRPWEFKGSR